jgi:hypothetical protein
MPAPVHIQEATLDKYIEGWRKFSPEEMLSVFSEDCKQQMLPCSLGVPARSRAEAQATLPKIAGILTNHQVNKHSMSLLIINTAAYVSVQLVIHEVVHDAAKSKAVVYANSTADTLIKDVKWRNECALFFSFTEDGEQISRLEEMVDTKFYGEFFPKFQKYLQEQGVHA